MGVTACGPSVTGTDGDAGQPSDTAAGASPGADAPLDEVYAAVDGLTGEERRQRLIELAQEEDGEFNLYGTLNIEQLGPIADAFEDATDLPVSLYRSSSNQMMQRLLQEAQADFTGADVVNVSGAEMPILDREGLLLPLRTPATDVLVDSAVFDTWAGIQLNVFTPVWNTDLVGEDEAPRTWEDVLTNFRDGRLVMDLADYDWFAALVSEYFVQRQGMSEDEAVELFREAAAGGVVVDGHTLMTELVAAGEHEIAADAFAHAPLLHEPETPVAWQPAVEPLIMRPNGIAVHRDTTNPATSLLFIEFMLDEGQEMLVEFGRTPASTEASGGISRDLDIIGIDLETLLDEREKWETLYEEVVQASGGRAD